MSAITLTDPTGLGRFDAVRLTPEQAAEILGCPVAEMRIATSIDRAAGALSFDGDPATPFQGPVGHIRRRKVVR